MADNILDEITYTDHITVDEYNTLRRRVDWIPVAQKRAAVAIGNSFFICIARREGKPIGMVRIISDGGYSFFITDVIVDPAYQGKHIGTELITRALAFIEKDVKEGETVMISLMSAYQRETFYKRFGFHQRPFGNHGSGMSVWVSRNEAGDVTTF